MLTVYILAGGLAPPDLNVLLRVSLGLLGLHAPVSRGVYEPHESCALALPRWVPVLPVRSRGSMPALGAINLKTAVNVSDGSSF